MGQNYFKSGAWNAICSTCNQEKSPDKFYTHSNGKIRRQCNDCLKSKQKIWRRSNLEKGRIRSREYAKKNPEKVKELTRNWRKANLEYDAYRASCYRARKRNQCPKWANLDKIKEIYLNCPKGYHVDHVIPLKGKLVSGLHTESNLQYLPAIENIRKRNVYKLL